MSFWLKNFGKHKAEEDGSGKDKTAFLSLEESFVFYYDTKTTFRVYVDAREKYLTAESESIYLPLNEWLNVQVAIKQNFGITVMTFN